MFARQKSPAPNDTDTPQATVKAARQRRPLLIRLFGIKPWGAIRLVLLCVAVGIFQKLTQAARNPETVDVPSAVVQIWETTLAGLGWAFQNGWQPALTGAVIVLPIWVLYRLVTLPFRKTYKNGR